jgi:isocitrate/isopropylmalate dehydrogenase
MAMLLTAKLMLDWLKENDMATRLETAIARVIKEGKVRTYDMGGNDSTLDVAKAIADYASS